MTLMVQIFKECPHPSLKHLEYVCHNYPSHSQILPTQFTACRSVMLSLKDRGEWVKYSKILSCGKKEAWVFAKPHFAHLLFAADLLGMTCNLSP